MESEKTDDHDHLIDSVRAAFSQHSDSRVDPQAETLHEPADVEHQREADQSSIDMSLAVTAKLNDEDRRGEQSKQTRDLRGRFKSTSATSTGVDGAAGALHVPQAPAVAPLTPPSSWSPEAKAEWSSLPRASQEAINKREFEISKGFQDYRGRAERHAEIEAILAPRRERLARSGITEVKAVEHLFELNDHFERDPVSALAHFAQHMPLTREQALGIANVVLQRGGISPQESGGPSQQQIEQYVQQRIATALAQTEVQRFEAKAPEHYGLVKGLMQQLLQSGAASTMQDAYRQACQHHPAVQSIEGQRRDRERLEKKIRASGHSLDGAPHGVAATPPRSNGRATKFGDVADDVRAAMASLT